MRWLYHLRPADRPRLDPDRTSGQSVTSSFAPASLEREGFIHCSHRDRVLETAHLYFAEDARADLEVLQIDPRRLDVPLREAETPRGPMPHVHGAIPRDAIRGDLQLDDFGEDARAPDEVTGTRIAFVGFAGMTLLDLVGPLDALSRIAGMGFDRETTCTVVSATEEPIYRAAGVRLEGAPFRPSLEGFDLLVIAGGMPARTLCHDREILDWLRGFPENRLAASVCTGALFLGALGRLKGKRATTHRSALALLPDFGAVVDSARVVDEGQVVTAGGVTSGIDLGLHLVRRLLGDEAAARIGAQMEWSP